MADWGEGSEGDWKVDTGDSWKVDAAAATSYDESNVLGDATNKDFGADAGEQNGFIGLPPSKHSGDIVCRNCQEPGHVARECPEPKKMTGECFNCGEVGHNKADCTNPKIEKPFTGECHYCKQEGHRAGDCPTKPAEICRNCLEEGHKPSECTASRMMDNSGVPEMSIDAAWAMLKQAGKEKEIEDFKTAVKGLAKADSSLTYADLELKLRAANIPIFLIALDKEIPNTMTNVDLQGKPGCKYNIGYFFSAKPKRPFMAQWWPTGKEDNFERLKNAGQAMDSLVPVCRNCKEQGHTSKECKEDKIDAVEAVSIKCSNCNEDGHRLRDCPKERAPRGGTCRNCNQPGHKASECTEPRSAANVECRRCGEMGHFSKECPNSEGGDSRACRNCGEEGHIAKECEKPKNPATTTCRNCDEVGHFSRDCPKPKDWSRVKCQNCGEMGHGAKRCPSAANEDTSYGENALETDTTTYDGNDTSAQADSAPAGTWQAEVTIGSW